MEIIPQIETASIQNYLVFERNIFEFIDKFKKELKSLAANLALDLLGNKLVIEQNAGFNGIIICKDLMKDYSSDDRDNPINTVYAFNMRDKNRIAIMSDLTTLMQIGIKEIIISEGVHPLRTSFQSAKSVYDMDVLGLTSAVKDSCDFNLGVVVRASIPADLLKITKLNKMGADKFIINYSDDIDVDIVSYIKNTGKKFYILIKWEDIKSSREDFFKKVSEFGVSGLIIKTTSDKTISPDCKPIQ